MFMTLHYMKNSEWNRRPELFCFRLSEIVIQPDMTLTITREGCRSGTIVWFFTDRAGVNSRFH